MEDIDSSFDNSHVARIPLVGGQYALVDVVDFEWLSQHEWKCSSHGYAYRMESETGRKIRRYMHREIMGDPPIHVDHINGMTLDNRRDNLRLTTHQQNQFNSRKRTQGASRYKGVSRVGKKWTARITKDGVTLYLGLHPSELEAAKAYDKAARQMFGPYACTNLN